NAFNSRISLKNNCPNKQAVARIAGENIFGGRADLLILLPHRTIQGNYLRVSQHSSHAVADDDVGAMVWIKLIDLVQLFAQSPRGIKNRVSGWISKNPELIMLANFGIGLQPIDRLDPGKRSRKKPVNKNQGNSIRIVGLEKVESGFLRIVTAANTTEESNQQEIGRWLIITDRRRKVGCERTCLPFDHGRRLFRRASQTEQGVVTLEIERGRNRRTDSMSRREILTRSGLSNSNQRSADARLMVFLLDQLFLDLVRRRERGEIIRRPNALCRGLNSKTVSCVVGSESQRMIPQASAFPTSQ